MSEYDNLEQELTESLAALSQEKPCGCHETENPFAEFSASDDLAGELQSALNALGGEGDMMPLSAEEAAEFASVAGSSGLSLDDIASALEQNPGLKITFSF